ncbi:MAG TPA: hypothetical protein VGR06_22295 [Actinophytocola sp.]|jgi:hypothetical protein|uniref:hypothetical protein n=1 Tax=Actinophytocola sp. TaxID=1872138 RepID=UPI002DFB2120|nr:hypothetical protein [Actinophytocola sp.]
MLRRVVLISPMVRMDGSGAADEIGCGAEVVAGGFEVVAVQVSLGASDVVDGAVADVAGISCAQSVVNVRACLL